MNQPSLADEALADPSLVGRTGAPFTMWVELGKVREFARAVGSSHPAHLEGDAPVAPPTFLASAQLWRGLDGSPWTGIERDRARLLHGAQEYVFHGPPPRAGTELTARSRIDRVYEKVGGRGGVMQISEEVTEFRDISGRLVAEARSTSIETARPPGGD